MNTFGFGFIIKPSKIDDNGTCVINSLKKSLINFTLYMMASLVVFVIIFMRFGDVLFSTIKYYYIIAVMVFAFVFNMISIYFHLRKTRIELDSTGIEVYVDKKPHSISWYNVEDVSLTTVSRSKSTRAGEYYKITYRDVVGYPFNNILAEKTPALEEDIARYYKKSSDSF